MNYPDVCIHEGRIDRVNGGRRCLFPKVTGYQVCPGECGSMLTPTDIEIRRGECINRGHTIGHAVGWTREKWI